MRFNENSEDNLGGFCVAIEFSVFVSFNVFSLSQKADL